MRQAAASLVVIRAQASGRVLALVSMTDAFPLWLDLRADPAAGPWPYFEHYRADCADHAFSEVRPGFCGEPALGIPRQVVRMAGRAAGENLTLATDAARVAVQLRAMGLAWAAESLAPWFDRFAARLRAVAKFDPNSRAARLMVSGGTR